jgi:hypothetical protein
MPYWLRFAIFLLIANVVIFFAAYRLREYVPLAFAIFVVIAVYVVIVVGQRVLRKANL